MFIKEPVKQRNILKATQKIKNKDQANTNTKTEPTTGMNRGQRIKIENLQPGKDETFSDANIYQWKTLNSCDRWNEVALKYLFEKPVEKKYKKRNDNSKHW